MRCKNLLATICLCFASSASSARVHSDPSRDAVTHSASRHEKSILCYYGSWASHRSGRRHFDVESINPFLCTHLIYAFAGLDHNHKIKSLDPTTDVAHHAYERFNKLKTTNPALKTLISIGGWNEGSLKFSSLASSPSSRKDFVTSVVHFVNKYNFDGVDIAWEYPGSRGGNAEDKANFVQLLRELRGSMGTRMLLTVAVGALQPLIDVGYDVRAITRLADYMILTAYDYHGPWENSTGHIAPLYQESNDSFTDVTHNVESTVNYVISKGAPREKLILGLPVYGRTFNLKHAYLNNIYAPIFPKGEEPAHVEPARAFGYNEICQKLITEHWTVIHDQYHMVPYAHRGKQWLSFEDVSSISAKAQLIKRQRLAGAMVWSLENDDFDGDCHGVRFPMISAVNRVFESLNTTLPSKLSPAISQGASRVTTTLRPTSTTHKSTSSPTRQPTVSSLVADKKHKEVPAHSPSQALPLKPTTLIKAPSTTSRPPLSTSPWSALKSNATRTKAPHVSQQNIANQDARSSCRREGLQGHPHDCRKFLKCVRGGSVSLIGYEYSCPTGTAFQRKDGRCEWASEVATCKRAPTSSGLMYANVDGGLGGLEDVSGEVQEVGNSAEDETESRDLRSDVITDGEGLYDLHTDASELL